MNMQTHMRNYIEHDEKGLITGSYHISHEIYELNKSTKNFVEGKGDIETHYVDVGTGEIEIRPQQQTKLTNTTLSNLPVPCTIHINGTPYECDSDTAELMFVQPASYKIRVESWPYQDWETTYENQA